MQGISYATLGNQNSCNGACLRPKNGILFFIQTLPVQRFLSSILYIFQYSELYFNFQKESWQNSNSMSWTVKLPVISLTFSGLTNFVVKVPTLKAMSLHAAIKSPSLSLFLSFFLKLSISLSLSLLDFISSNNFAAIYRQKRIIYEKTNVPFSNIILGCYTHNIHYSKCTDLSSHF